MSVHGIRHPLDGGITKGEVLAVSGHPGTGLQLALAQTTAWAAANDMFVTIVDQDGWSKHLSMALSGAAVVFDCKSAAIDEDAMRRQVLAIDLPSSALVMNSVAVLKEIQGVAQARSERDRHLLIVQEFWSLATAGGGPLWVVNMISAVVKAGGCVIATSLNERDFSALSGAGYNVRYHRHTDQRVKARSVRVEASAGLKW